MTDESSAMIDEEILRLCREIRANGGRALRTSIRPDGYCRLTSEGEALISLASCRYVLAYLRGFAACQRGPGLFASVQSIDFEGVNHAL